MPPSKDFKPRENCRICSVKFTEENKVKNQNLCRDCNSKLCKEYKKNNPKIISSYNKKYKAENRDEISEYNHNYNLNNREAIQKRQTAQHRERKLVDPNYRITCTVRARLNKTMKANSSNYNDLISCSPQFLRSWFQSKFTDKMTFDNHGTYWHIDHVVPCSAFNLLDPEELKVCFHWTNLQPLESRANQSKVNKIDKVLLLEQILSAVLFAHSKQQISKYKNKYNLSNPKLLDFLVKI